MEASEYAAMDRLEGELWWYRGLHALLAALGRRFAPAGRIVDAGCGSGGLLAALRHGSPAAWLAGVEIAPQAAAWAMAKSGAPVAVGSVNQLPVADACIDAMFSADVLCHRAVEPALALAEASRALAPGGTLLLNLPAYEWMKSAHDRAVHNDRRFTRAGALALVRAAGLTPVWSSYWNCLLFPVMALRRLASRGDNGKSDVAALPAWLNMTLGWVVGLERRLILMGLRMPFGGSLIVVARKNVV